MEDELAVVVFGIGFAGSSATKVPRSGESNCDALRRRRSRSGVDLKL